jgi:hypothetical protein
MKIATIKLQTPDCGEQRNRSYENLKEGFDPCPICGKNTNWDEAVKAGRVLHWVDGGANLTDDMTEKDDGSDLGCWPVGATCWRKWLKACKAEKEA